MSNVPEANSVSILKVWCNECCTACYIYTQRKLLATPAWIACGTVDGVKIALTYCSSADHMGSSGQSQSVCQSSESVLLVNDPSLWQGTWLLMTEWLIPDDRDRVSDTWDTNSILIKLIAWEDFIKSVLYLVTYNKSSLYSKYPSSKTESKQSWNKT